MQILTKNEIVEKLKTILNKTEDEVKNFICECLNISFTEFVMKETFSFSHQQFVLKCANKAKRGKPLNKILKRAMFYGRMFYVNSKVLAPRIETELLVEKTLSLIVDENCQVLDLCTGSGCVGITLKKENENICVTCADISCTALKVAKNNAKTLNANIKFVKTNMFSNINGKYNLIVCNPPYIPLNEYKALDVSVKKYDPKISLLGGEDGLKFYRILSMESAKYLTENGIIVCEIGYNQGESVKEIFEKHFKEVEIINDYSNNNRIVVARSII